MRIGLFDALRKDVDLALGTHSSVPTGLNYLSSYLKEQLAEDVEVIIERKDLQNLLTQSLDLIGISSYTTNMVIAEQIARDIKKQSAIPVILGGPHITAVPETLPAIFDIGVIGEGEVTFLELIKLYLKNKNFPSQELAKIQGLAFHHEGKVVLTENRPLIDPLDQLPYPERKLIPSEVQIGLLTSRGCPYQCKFCCAANYWRKHRYFTAEYVLGEVNHLLEQYEDLTQLDIYDDLFVFYLPRLRKIHQLFLENNIQKNRRFVCNIRANTFSEEICRILKDLNFSTLYFGAESGSDATLKYYNKQTTVAQNQQVLDLCFDYGFKVHASFILGGPEETEEDLEQTYSFITKNKHKIHVLQLPLLVPFPGTPIWDYAEKRGLASLQMNWDLLYQATDIYNPQNYIYLNEKMPQERFSYHVSRFDELSDEINYKTSLSRELVIGLQLMNS